MRGVKMSQKRGEQKPKGRTLITRAALELAIAEAVRNSSPECSAFIGVIVERVIPASPGGVNWTVKGIKFGKTERDRCSASVSSYVEERQRDFEVSD
jgi:hypothetical protein